MAHTYDNFASVAKAAGLMNQFTEQDLQIAHRNPEFGLSLLSLLKDKSDATTAEQQLLATEAANQLRKSYGVYNTDTLGTDSTYAGSYGTQINDLMDQITDYGSQNNANQDSYQQLLDSIVKQQPFSYDLESDPSWESYKKAYMREGDRASANALAQASAASGGRASSYALTAAQQAGNYYAGQLADIIPSLEQNAYSQYLSDFNNRLKSLDALKNDQNSLNIGLTDVNQSVDVEDFIDKKDDGLYSDLMEDLEGGYNSEKVDTSDYAITNRNGDGWVAVGNGRMTWTELERAVNQGRIIEIIDPVKRTVTYKYPTVAAEPIAPYAGAVAGAGIAAKHFG